MSKMNGVISDSGVEKGHYARSGLKDGMANEYLEKLLQVMETEKLYLNSNLTIDDLSKTTGIPKHHITEVLNERYSQVISLLS